jgi:hypothetical protein
MMGLDANGAPPGSAAITRVKQRSSARLVGAIIVLVAAAPIISALISGIIAGVLGCQLDEGSTHPCPFMGADLSEILYSMVVVDIICGPLKGASLSHYDALVPSLHPAGYPC